ncbi:phage tail spike protein [Anaerovoracaceae bacterium 41-7]|uniref:phage tail spike protein n=1 Tax=Emergencia sp. JLR.KK010 TaxID=3114296 RepID=UPI0030D3F43F
MYKIFADDILIYDSTFDDYKIGKGQISLETNKSGSFVFSLYPEHFFYDKFIKLKTTVTVYKDNRIIFRGRILNDSTDYWNDKTLTCEGELGFLQDSIIRPFTFKGSPRDLFAKFIVEHNSQVDEFKRFKIGQITVTDPNDYINRSNESYDTTLDNLNSRLIGDSLGGYFYITHGDDGQDPIPTLNYLADFEHVSTQHVEFGVNLKDYTKTVQAGDIATAIIPLGASLGEDSETNQKLTITAINSGKDYVYDSAAVALYGWIFRVVNWDNVSIAENLKSKAEDYLLEAINQNITIELNAIDLHLLDRSIESFNLGDYVKVTSTPHNFDATMLCNRQSIDLLNPQNDSLTLGYTRSTFTELNNKIASSISSIPTIQQTVNNVSNKVTNLTDHVNGTDETATDAFNHVQQVAKDLSAVSGDLEAVAKAVADNARNIAENTMSIEDVIKRLEALENI